MANPMILRRRIKTAQNVSKTTKAMQMIAASKLKKAQTAALSSRAYVEKLSALSKNLSAKLTGEKLHPYLVKNDSDLTLLIVMSPDKGLCGGLITNLLREYFKVDDISGKIVIAIGKKVEGYAMKSKNELIASFPFGNSLPLFDRVYPLVELINEYYLSSKVSKVQVLYSNFETVFSQVPTLSTLLPLSFEEIEESKTPYELFEPSIEEILPSLLSHYLEMKLYQFFLENYLSEQSSRMLAMQNATNNAKDIIEELRLEYNKARQESITNQILDISSATMVGAQ